MKTYSGDELVNIGTGADITIAEFARVVAATVGYAGEISFEHHAAGRYRRQIASSQPAGKTRLARRHFARRWYQARLIRRIW